jgi:ankyrin repeat protein
MERTQISEARRSLLVREKRTLEADVFLSGGEDGSALSAASGVGNLAIINLLLEAGADPNIEGNRGFYLHK